MSAPENLTVVIEPSANGVTHYLLCAPEHADAAETGLMNLYLRITNNGVRPVTVNKILLRILGSRRSVWRSFTVDLTIAAGASRSWTQPSDFVFGPSESASIRIELTAAGFSDPALFPSPLARHENPTASGSYRFWAATKDLESGEFWHVHGTAHGQTREQSFAYDVGVRVRGDNGWLHPGTAGDDVEQYRAWGKPIYAIANGTVRHARNDFPTNKTFGDVSPAVARAIAGLGDGNGNFATIASADETVLYAHLQPGTVAVSPGDTVSAGDFIGLLGHSGASSHPHLHIGAVRTNAGTKSWVDHGRPMRFHHAHAIAWESLNPKQEHSPWVKLDGRGVPTVDCAVWPADFPPLTILQLDEVEIDPLALLLPSSVYVKLTLPDPPPIEVLREQVRSAVRRMIPAERKAAAGRLKQLDAALQVALEEIGS